MAEKPSNQDKQTHKSASCVAPVLNVTCNLALAKEEIHVGCEDHEERDVEVVTMIHEVQHDHRDQERFC